MIRKSKVQLKIFYSPADNTSMRIYVQRLDRVPTKLYTEIYNNNLRREGTMRRDLVYCRQTKPDDVYCIFCLENGVMLGWALVTPREKDGRNWVRPIQLWVKKKYRRQGIGTKLLKFASNYWQGVRFIMLVHSPQSNLFYKKHKKLGLWKY